MDLKKLEQLMIDRALRLPIYCRESIESTNDLAKQAELTFCGQAFVLAERQTGGRGRQGRQFYSPEGGVYLSHAFLPKRKGRLPVTIAAAVAVCDAVEVICGRRPEIKWPNDILLDGKKICGILAEGFSSGRKGMVIIGVGLNLNTERFPEDIADIAASLKQLCGREFDFEQAAVELMGAMIELPGDSNVRRFTPAKRQAASILEKYRRDCSTVGREVSFMLDNEPYTGVAESIAEDGALEIRLNDGRLLPLRFGEVTAR